MEQLEEVWIEDLEKATDKKIQEECIPGKPISLFTTSSPKVNLFMQNLCMYICEFV